MIFRKKQKIGDDDASLRYLAKVLSSEELKPQMDLGTLAESRKHLLKTIKLAQQGQSDYVTKVEQQLITGIRKVTHNLLISNYQRISMKERVLDYARGNKQRFDFLAWMKNYKFVFSSLILFIFALTTFISVPSSTYVTKASKWTFIEEVKGEAYILRDGKSLEAKQDLNLEEGDILITKSNSFITVRFFDDSISRLGQNTAVEIKKLYSEPLNSTKTAIEVGLQEGYVWAKVVNLNEQSSFIINTDNAVATVKNKAAFEMEKNDKVTTVMVFENVVDLKTKSTIVDHSQPVVAGFTAQIASQLAVHSTDNVSDHTFVVSESLKNTDDWVSLNMNLDKQYEEKIKKENQDFIDKSVDDNNNSLGFLQNVQKSTKAIFLDSEFEKTRDLIDEANFSFIKAQKLLVEANHKNQKRTEALQYLYKYRSTIRAILAKMPELKIKDKAQAEVLLNQIDEFIDSHQKSLALVLPGEKLFTAKEIIDEVSSYLGHDQLSKIEYLLADAKDTLLEVQGLMDKGQFAQAEARFNLYSKKVDQLIVALNSTDTSALNGKVNELFQQQIDQIKLLTSIEKELEKKNILKMLEVVNKVRQASIEKLLSVYRSLKPVALPFEFFQELRSLVVNYFKEGEAKVKVLDELDELMKNYSQYTLFKDTEFTTHEIIRESEASQDAATL